MSAFPAANDQLPPSGAREALMRSAAALFRARGLDAPGAAEADRQFGSREALILAIFAEAVRRLNAPDPRPWRGYGGGMRRSLAKARSFEDGYVLLIRHGHEQPAYQALRAAIRQRARRRIQALLWAPEAAPADPPVLLDEALEPMVLFCDEALARWVETGDPARDEYFVRWCAQMMRDWRRNAAELLNLDSPEQEWPFDTEGLPP